MGEVYVSNHPLVRLKLSILRSVDTEPNIYFINVPELERIDTVNDNTRQPINLPRAMP